MELVQWERIDGTDIIDVSDFGQAKVSLIPLPVIREDLSHLFDYKIENRLAVICNLYPFSRSDHCEILTKSAIYSAKSFLTHTDMRDQGVPFYFVVSETHFQTYRAYFEIANIPETHILRFDETQFATAIEKGLVNPIRYYCVRHDGLRDFQRVIWTDADTHALRLRHQDKYPMCERLFDAWQTPLLTPRYVYGFSPEHFHSAVDRRMRVVERNAEEKALAIWKQIGEVVDEDPVFLRNYWLNDTIYDMRGYCVGFDDFRYDADFIAHTLKCCQGTHCLKAGACAS